MLFAVRRASELVDIPAGEVLATGGTVRRRLVVQILADALQRPLTVVDVRAASAVGAALLAAEGAGVSTAAGSHRRRTVEPRPDASVLHAYERWVSRLPVSQA
jgi:xylulokinase